MFLISLVDDDESLRQSYQETHRICGLHGPEDFASAEAQYLVSVGPQDSACLILDLRLPA